MPKLPLRGSLRWISFLAACGLLAVSATLIPWHRASQAQSLAPGQSGQAQAVALNDATYGAAQAVRQAVCLTDQDLAAMGVSSDTATAVLGQLLSWSQANQNALQQANDQTIQAQAALQQAVTKVHTGPRDETLIAQIPALSQQIATTMAQRNQLLQGLVTQINGQLSTSQAQIWAAARNNAGLPDRYRYVPGLSAAQGQQLSTALQLYGEGSPRLITLEQQLLAGNQTAMIATAQSNLNQSFPAVTAASAQVLPVPSDVASLVNPTINNTPATQPSVGQ